MYRFRIAVIIPTCDRPHDLRVCLNSVLLQMGGCGGADEVIVTDDSRGEETRLMVEREFPGVTYHAGPRRGPAANRNAAARQVDTDWLIFLDDDCVPQKDWLQSYRSAMDQESGGLLALEGRTLRDAELPSLLWEAPHNPEGGMLISCNFAMSVASFREAGGFDERYPGAAFEDTEFAARFRAKGGQVVFVPGATVIHPLRRCPNPRRLAGRWEGRVVYALDQGASPPMVRFWLPWHVGRVIQSRFRGKAWSRENFNAALLFAREWLWVCCLTPGWVSKWARERRSQFWTEHVRLRGAVPKYGF